MAAHVLVTGGAGFIGSHLCDALLARGHRVRALDNLEVQVHGPGAPRPDYLHPEVDLVVGDVRDPDAVERAVEGVDAVFHLASLVGVGQSMYEIERYTDVNVRGTAVLLEALVRRPVSRLVVASSMSIYGEGAYRDADGRSALPVERRVEDLRAGRWEPRDAGGRPLLPLPTPEVKRPALPSVYALTKYDQEQMCRVVGRAYGIPTVVLRFFNTYGTRQALSNPYTGVLAIFASRLLNGQPPLIHEDGLQKRDFVSVLDVVQAAMLALSCPDAPGGVFNVASGRRFTVAEAARLVAASLGRDDIVPEITSKYRVGDVRHCFADVTQARTVLGYEPRVPLEEGLVELAGWLEGQAAVDRGVDARAELEARGLSL